MVGNVADQSNRGHLGSQPSRELRQHLQTEREKAYGKVALARLILDEGLRLLEGGSTDDYRLQVIYRQIESARNSLVRIEREGA